jgi:cytochrome oxidase Cu insertion factor (SCO1/SenC/PrrC family)
VAALAAGILVTSDVHARDAEQDWQAIVALDAGPGGQPGSGEAAGQMVLAHLARQEKALRDFFAAYPRDPRTFEARLRLARLLQIRADFEDSEKPRAEARRLLEQLEKTATPEQRVELEFSKVARLMRSLRSSGSGEREEVLKAARQFQSTYPGDRRIAALLTEVSTLFDAEPKTKQALLEDAQAVATEADLKERIADDLKRVHLLGQEIPLRFTSLQGEEITPGDLVGHPTFIIFFADFSPPSATALSTLQDAVAELPSGSVRVFGIALDEKRGTLLSLMKTHGVTWPVAFDGKGWQSPLVREFGINALPTVWLLDVHGRLRSLSALEGAAAKAQELMREP